MQPAEGAMPTGSAWAFEFVFDGLRAVAYLEPDRVRLRSATDRSITSSYPELAALSRLARARGPLVLDGKIVTLDRLGRVTVPPLRQRMSTAKPSAELVSRTPVRFYLSDVLYADGAPALDLPYRRRRELLAELDLTGLPVDLAPYFLDTDGQTVLHAAQLHGLGGVLAKRLDSRYQPGRRTRAWVQTVPRHTQSVVVGGWLPGTGAEAGERPAALLVGVPGPDGLLRYLGRVSAGLDQPARRELASWFAGRQSARSPFVDPPSGSGDPRWLLPALVGEVSCRRWEVDGRLRQASWLRLTPDAHPASVRGPLVLVGPARAATAPAGPPTAASDLAALEEDVRLAQAQVRALRAQISPHFVYNVLTTIASYVRTDPARARDLLHDFAEYTRYSFRAGAETTTLGAELANADRYLVLESARFGDRLRVERDIAAGLDSVALPFLTLQQLVENAVQHGIEGTPGGGTVRITASADAEGHVLTVSDDGLGMDPERLTDAVTDVRHRLAAAPGPVAALDVRTAPAEGTTITLRLPNQAGRLEE
jgi:hypothetical protein